MNMFYLLLVSMLGVLSSFLALSFQYKHFLSVLLALEAITMHLFFMVFIMINNISLSGESALIFITMGACEASLGLAILVAIIRVKGNDYVSSFCSQMC